MSIRRADSEESRKFWEEVDGAVAEVAEWPSWKVDCPDERRCINCGAEVSACGASVVRSDKGRPDRLCE